MGLPSSRKTLKSTIIREGHTITSNIDVSSFMGKNVKDEGGEVGKIVSFLIDSSGQVVEALIESRKTTFLRYPLERLKINQEEIFLITDIEKKAEFLSEKFPIMHKKRKILEKLSENKEILPEIYENLCAEFDKTLEDMKSEAQNLLDDIDEQIKVQEELIKTLHLARTFLEIEHGVGNVKDDVHQQSLVSILKEISNASYGKINILRIKDRVSSILLGDEEAKLKTEIKDKDDSMIKPTEEKTLITVHMTQE